MKIIATITELIESGIAKELRTSPETKALWETIHGSRTKKRWQFFGPLSDVYGNIGDQESMDFCKLIFEKQCVPFGGIPQCAHQRYFQIGDFKTIYTTTYFRKWRWFADLWSIDALLGVPLQQNKGTHHLRVILHQRDLTPALLPDELRLLQHLYFENYYLKVNGKRYWEGSLTIGSAYEALFVAYHLALNNYPDSLILSKEEPSIIH